MVLSKVSNIDSADATTYLTSAMKGYNVEAKDTLGIVDKLNSVDLVSATSASGLANAMSRTANMANLAGVSMDKLLGYLAVVGETTQKEMSEVGTSFQTIFSRMGSVAAGKNIDSEGESLNNVETVLTKVGIKLRDSQNTFRNFGDVLDEVGSKWKNYSNVEQNQISTALAGTRQKENFLVLMQNYSKATEYATTAQESNGSSMKKMQVYEASVEAATKRATAAWEAFSTSVLNSDLIKFFVNLGTDAGNALTTINNQFHTLPMLVALATAALSGFKNVGVFKTTENTDNLSGLSIKTSSQIQKQAQQELAQQLQQDIGVLQNYQDGLNKLDKATASSADYTKLFNDTVGRSSKAVQEYAGVIKDGKGTAEAYAVEQKTVATSTENVGIASKAAAVGMKALALAENVGIMLVVTVAIQALASGIDYLVNYQQKAIDSANDLTSKYQSSTDTINSNIKTLEGLKTEFSQLSDGVDDNGKNVGLSTEQYKRYHEIVKQIVSISPSLIKGYDDEGNALINKNTALENAITLQKQELDITKQKYLLDASQVWSGAQQENNKAKGNYTGTSDNDFSNGASGIAYDFGAAISNNNLFGKPFSISSSDLDKLKSQFKEVGLDFNKITNGNIEEDKKLVNQQDQLIAKLTTENNLTDEQKNKLKQVISQVETENQARDNATQKQIALIDTWGSLSQNSSWYGGVSQSGSLDSFNKALSNFIEKNPTATFEQIQVEAKKLGESFVQVKDKVPTQAIEDLKTQLKNGTISTEEYNQGLTTQIASISNLANSYRKSNPELANFLDLIAKSYTDFQQSATGMDAITNSVNGLETKVDKVKSDITNLATSLKDLDNAATEVQEGQALSGEEVVKLIDEYPELADAVHETTGGYTIELSVLEALRKQKIQTQIDSINAEITTANAAVASAQTQLAAYSSIIGAIKNVADAKAALANEGQQQTDLGIAHGHVAGDTTAIDKDLQAYIDNSDKVENAQKKLKALQTELTIVTNPNYAKSIKGNTAAEKEATSAAKAHVDALNKEKDALENQKKVIQEANDQLSKDQSNINALLELVEKLVKQGYDDEKQTLEDINTQLEKNSQTAQDANDKELSALKDKISLQKELLQKQKDERTHAQELADKEKAVTDLKIKLKVLELDKSDTTQKRRLELENELADKTKELDDYKYDYDIEEQNKTLDNLGTQYEKEYEAKNNLLKKELDAEKANNQKRIDYITEYTSKEVNIREDALNLIQNDSGTLLNRLLEYNRIYENGVENSVIEIWNAATESLSHFDNGQQNVLGTLNSIVSKMSEYASQISSVDGQIKGLESTIAEAQNALNSMRDTASGVTSNIENGVDSASQRIRDAQVEFLQSQYQIILSRLQSGQGTQDDARQLSQIRGDIKAIRGYATGTLNSVGGVVNLDEEGIGSELIIRKPKQGRLTSLEQGSIVWNADKTSVIDGFATNPQKYIADQLSKMQFSSFANITPNNIGSPITIDNSIKIDGNVTDDIMVQLKAFQQDTIDKTVSVLHKNAFSGGYTPSIMKR